MLLVLLVASSCASANPTVVEAASAPGFWSGWFHGVFAVTAFIASFFDRTIGVYEVANSGGWYDFGFIVGVGSFRGLAQFHKKIPISSFWRPSLP